MYADVVKHLARPTNFFFDGILPRLVPLDPAGNGRISFNGGGRFTIVYSAECAAAGFSDVDFLSIDIIVDAVPLAPTNSFGDAFCTANHTQTVPDGWVTATTSARTASRPAAIHSVEIVVRISGKKAGWLGDSSLLIIK